MVRAGLALCALAGVLAVLSPGSALVEGRVPGPGERTRTLEPDSAFITSVGVAAIVLLGLAAAVPYLWAHLAGIAAGAAFGYFCGGTVAVARASDDFAPGADIALKGGGVLLVTAFWLALAGVGIALFGIRAVALARARAADTEGPPRAPAEARTSPRAIAALALGVGGVLTVASGALAIALGTLALSDIRASGGRLGGRGLALGGIVLGVLVLSLLTAIVGVGALAASPTA